MSQELDISKEYFPSASDELPPDFYPTLPDGTKYDGTGGDVELIQQAKTILQHLVQSHEFRPEHSQLLRMILDTHMEQTRIRRGLQMARVNGMATEVADFTKANDQISRTLVRLYKDLGLLDRKGRDSGPFQLVQELRRRVPDFMKKHGMERTMACQRCGRMHLVYLIGKTTVEVDWKRVQRILEKNPEVGPQKAKEVVKIMQGIELTTTGDIKTRWVDHPLAHPFLSDDFFPIWSPEVRELVESQCECGRPKLTWAEAAKILRISEVGFDQLLQEDEKRQRGEKSEVFRHENQE